MEGNGVTFINTDGMAFIGPGSEWFWTAVSGIVLAITFIAIYRQLRGQREQARHNTQLLRSQAHYNALVLGHRPWEMLIDNGDLARIMTSGMAAPEALNEVEWLRCSTHIALQFDSWEYTNQLYADGSIPTEYWAGEDDFYRRLIVRYPAYARFWSEQAASYSEPFHSHAAGAFPRKASSPSSA
jgi:hypothetical protein